MASDKQVKDMEQEKKKKRADRFGTDGSAMAAVDPEEEERRKKRMARFGPA